MIQALYASVDGIQVQQTRMDVIGNDLANINTTGFKNQDVHFSDLISQQLRGATAPNKNLGGSNPIEYGLGVSIGATTTNLQQGSLTATSNPSDLAIQGNGYFMVSNGAATSYTRDGSFELDAAGDIISSDTGRKLMGWTADSTGKIDTTTALSPASTLQVPIGALDAAQATTAATISGNLDSTFSASSTGTVTTTVYDSLGNPHDVTLQFNKPTSVTNNTPPGATAAWSWTAYSGDSASGTPIGTSSSPVYFNAAGQPITGTDMGTVTLPASQGASTTPINVDLSGITQLGSATSLNVTSQNGYPAGSLSSFAIGSDGSITGVFTNGLTKTLGQIGLATFSNPGGLQNVGANLYTTSPNSGSANVGTAESQSYGSINSGYLEQSNVDLSSSLTNLIVTQRGFEANTKMVSTVDTMLQDVIDMKH